MKSARRQLNRLLASAVLFGISFASGRADDSTGNSPSEPASAPRGSERAQAGRQMLDEVRRAWERPASAIDARVPVDNPAANDSLTAKKLRDITLPAMNFSGMEISRVIATLGVLTEEFDLTEIEPKGVNIILIDPTNADPVVNLTLRNNSLKRVLDLVTQSIGYHYEIEDDAVIVRPGGGQAALDTRFFPVSRSTVLRLTGKPAEHMGPPGRDTQPGGRAPATGATIESEGKLIRNFLQLAGVGFDAVPGATLAFDGSQLIVTQTARNLERVANILNRYRDLRQVEIEAKFMEVQEGALEELGVQWNVATQAARAGSPSRSVYTSGNGVTRTLAGAFSNATTSQEISISGGDQPEGGLKLAANAPTFPGGPLVAAGAAPFANLTGIVGEFDVNAVVRALSQKSGTELLSAPRITVLSGNQATITVAQEFRYPESYGQIQSQVGTGSISGGGSAGVSITSGTPQEFATRNVGVELKVLPTVEEDNRSISLDLNPRVTEFEGFVEYGGPSIAISGGTTVTVPPGFYQPIFAVREMTTRVTLWDGATLVMGGLTREEVKQVNDKVPVLGSLPLLGRLFRSKGETSQKRNLLIFVTASLVNAGGAPARQAPAKTAEEGADQDSRGDEPNVPDEIAPSS